MKRRLDFKQRVIRINEIAFLRSNFIIYIYIKEPKYKHLFVDLDNTLFDSRSLYNEAIRMAYERLASFHPKVKYMKFKELFLDVRQELKDKYKHKSISHNRAILFKQLTEKLDISFDAELIREMHEAYWFTVNVYIQPFPGVIETLQKIRDAGIRITAVSDGSLLSRLEKVESLRISKMIDYLIASEEVVYTKPEPAIFHLAMEKTGAKKGEVLMIGDSFSADITGGENFGIDTCWFNPEKKSQPEDTVIKPDYTITRFPQVLKVLGIK